jgi:ABC-type spermidine/putrescine transport system permease subunit II
MAARGRDEEDGGWALALGPVPRIVASIVFLYLTAPLFVILPISFSSSPFLRFPPPGLSLRWYERLFSEYEWIAAASTSLLVATLCALASTVIGVMAALAFHRMRIRGKGLLYATILAPLILPHIVYAIAVYFFFVQIRLVGTLAGLVLAHTVLGTPVVVMIVVATLQRFDVSLEQAALSLGASRLTAFWRVSFPLIRPGVLAGALFAFVSSLDELIIALFITRTDRLTLPIKMWKTVREEIDPTIAAVATLLIVATVLAGVIAQALRKGTEAYGTAARPAVEPLAEAAASRVAWQPGRRGSRSLRGGLL